MSQVLKVEEQEVIPKVKERQTLRSDNTDRWTDSISADVLTNIFFAIVETVNSLLVSRNNSDFFFKSGQQKGSPTDQDVFEGGLEIV